MRFDFEIDESLKRERNEKIEKLYTDPLVQQFLKKNDLNHDFFDKHFSYFQDWVENVKKCSGCQGIEFCVQTIPGKIKTIYPAVDLKSLRMKLHIEKIIAYLIYPITII